MKIFDLYFSKRWSFLFPGTCSTWRRLSEPYFSNQSQDFLHRVSPGLFASFRHQRIRVLREANQWWNNFHSSHSIFVVAFSSFVGIVAFLWLFVWLREQTFIVDFATHFCVVELTLVRMPILTRRSRASTCQILSARLSKNDTMVTFRLGYFFSSTHFDPATLMAQKVWRHCGLVIGHDRYSHARHCVGLLSNTGLFLPFSSFNATQSFPFLTTAPVSILPCLASKFRNRSF